MNICMACGILFGKASSEPCSFFKGQCDYCYANRLVTDYKYYGNPRKPKAETSKNSKHNKGKAC